MTHDWPAVVRELEGLLKLRSIVFGMKMFERREEMEAIERIRRPQSVHTLDQIVGQASRLGWTVGITSDDLVGAQCRAVVGRTTTTPARNRRRCTASRTGAMRRWRSGR